MDFRYFFDGIHQATLAPLIFKDAQLGRAIFRYRAITIEMVGAKLSQRLMDG